MNVTFEIKQFDSKYFEDIEIACIASSIIHQSIQNKVKIDIFLELTFDKKNINHADQCDI